MIYYVGYIPPKEFKNFYADLIRDVSKRFELNGLAQNNRVPHITLKSPFEISSSQSLDEVVSNFCQDQEPSSIEINGVGSFEKEVIFLHSQPSTQMIDTFRKLLNSLRGVKGMGWNEYDNPNKKLHITLAKGEELEGKFQGVYNYLKARDIKFTLPFDNITIFQKDGGKTSIHRTYNLRKTPGG